MRPLRLERWTLLRWLSVLAVLLHAAVGVRHNAHSLGVAFVSLEMADGAFCRGDSGAAMPTTGHERLPDGIGAPCPICAGSISGIGSPPVQAALPLTFSEPVPIRGAVRVAETIARDEPPPNRGPPSAA